MSLQQVPSIDVNASIKFYSAITKSTQYVAVNIKGETSQGDHCLLKEQSSSPHSSPSTSSPYSVKRLLTYFIGDSGILIIAYTVMIATVILILIIYHFYLKGRPVAPVVIHSPYIHSPGMAHSPPPYQYSSPYHPPPPNTTPGSYGPNKHTPIRLFSVSQ